MKQNMPNAGKKGTAAAAATNAAAPGANKDKAGSLANTAAKSGDSSKTSSSSSNGVSVKTSTPPAKGAPYQTPSKAKSSINPVSSTLLDSASLHVVHFTSVA